MIKILFVCHGNICRSPMAEFVMKDMVHRQSLDKEFCIESAATTTEEIWGNRGNPIYPPAMRELQNHGIGTPENDLGASSKRARLLLAEDYGRFDYIIGMDRENLYDMQRICKGDPDGKISLLLDYTDQPRDVADPWYTRNFGKTWDDIERGCRALLSRLVPEE